MYSSNYSVRPDLDYVIMLNAHEESRLPEILADLRQIDLMRNSLTVSLS
jgi:hypothetical protein